MRAKVLSHLTLISADTSLTSGTRAFWHHPHWTTEYLFQKHISFLDPLCYYLIPTEKPTIHPLIICHLCFIGSHTTKLRIHLNYSHQYFIFYRVDEKRHLIHLHL